MDPVSTAALSTVLAGLLKQPTEETSSRLVGALKKLLRRVPAPEGQTGVEIETLDAVPDQVDVGRVAEHLAAAARSDAAFARELQIWVEDARTVVGADAVANSNSGTVEGSLVQGRDFSGPMTFK